MSYDNTNTGILYKNERRRNDKDAEYTGSINVDGDEFWVNAWVKQGKAGSKMDGKKFFSLSLRPKERRDDSRKSSRDERPTGPAGPGASQSIEEADVPFTPDHGF